MKASMVAVRGCRNAYDKKNLCKNALQKAQRKIEVVLNNLCSFILTLYFYHIDFLKSKGCSLLRNFS